MPTANLTKPGEKKKLIVAGVLGVVAIIVLWWAFVGFGSRSATSSRRAVTPPNGPGSKSTTIKPGEERRDELSDLADSLRVVEWAPSGANVPEARRNIFAYYEPPPASKEAPITPTPTPTPTPPVLLAAISPSNVYARTADFTLEVSGDKFTPDLRIFVDGRELATKYRGPQQLSALIAAATIANPGVRQIVVRTSDGRVYSNSLQMSVAPPPTPNYTYVGLLSSTHRVDIAYVQDRNNKEILTVQRGDVLSGRFRVTSIADKELVLVDTNLKIRHSLAITEGEKGAGSPLARPTPRVDAEDDEP